LLQLDFGSHYGGCTPAEPATAIAEGQLSGRSGGSRIRPLVGIHQRQVRGGLLLVSPLICEPKRRLSAAQTAAASRSSDRRSSNSRLSRKFSRTWACRRGRSRVRQALGRSCKGPDTPLANTLQAARGPELLESAAPELLRAEVWRLIAPGQPDDGRHG